MKLRRAKPAYVRNANYVKVIAVLLLALYCLHILTAGADDIIARPPAEGAPASVLSQHADECWTGSQAALADLPGAAIVQYADGTTVYTTRPRLVNAAFNEVLASIGFGDVVSDRIDPIALCL